MEPFTKLSMLEQARYNKLELESKRLRRYQLFITQNFAEAELDERKLQYLSGLPRFKEARYEIREMLSYPFTVRRAHFLKNARRGLRKRQLIREKIRLIKSLLNISALN
ncbi:MAG: hypothetical protein R2824_26275 [Saprospiraceae bacterium]|nr:hypothetical protein [Lewinella sp.]